MRRKQGELSTFFAFQSLKTLIFQGLSTLEVPNKGIEMQINRSSQVEGSFGIIKQNMEYDRIRRRGLDKVTAEISLVCLGLVARKLFTLIEGNAKMDYWCAPDGLISETPKPYSLKKLMKIASKGANENLRSSYKKKGR